MSREFPGAKPQHARQVERAFERVALGALQHAAIAVQMAEPLAMLVVGKAAQPISPSPMKDALAISVEWEIITP